MIFWDLTERSPSAGQVWTRWYSHALTGETKKAGKRSEGELWSVYKYHAVVLLSWIQTAHQSNTQTSISFHPISKHAVHHLLHRRRFPRHCLCHATGRTSWLPRDVSHSHLRCKWHNRYSNTSCTNDLLKAPCITSAAAAAGCTDIACQCASSEVIQASALGCVVGNCGIPVALSVQAAAAAVCTACA